MTNNEISRLFEELANTTQSTVFNSNTGLNTSNIRESTPEREINY